MSFKRIIHDGILFILSDDELFGINTVSDDVRDVYIPHVFPSGAVINSIGSCFCSQKWGSYGKITIDDNISDIKKSAFGNSSVKEVVWSASCLEIPERCFDSSDIVKLSNIDNVVDVGRKAFVNSKICSIKWPKNCDSIPVGCFHDSGLKAISNLDHVAHIGEFAFRGTSISNFSCPPKLSAIPAHCFAESGLRKITNIEHIISIGSYAFTNSNLRELDLSKVASVTLEPLSLYGIDIPIIPSYYTSEDELSVAIRGRGVLTPPTFSCSF